MEKIGHHTNSQVGLIPLAVFWQNTFPISRNTILDTYKPSTVLFSKYLMYSLVCTPFSTVLK